MMLPEKISLERASESKLVMIRVNHGGHEGMRMANASAAHEPSMEEILASIRQIISEDGGSAAPKIDGVIADQPEARPGASVAEAERPLGQAPVAQRAPEQKHAEQKQAGQKPAEQKAIDQKPGGPRPVELKTVEQKPTEKGAAPSAAQSKPGKEAAAQSRPEASLGALMHRQASEQAARALKPDHTPAAAGRAPTAAQPAPTAAAEESPLLSPKSGDAISGAFGALAHTILAQNARTLEDVVTEMLQPMLKQWLDDNLPGIVERKVQEEIERVSRGRR